MWEPYRPTCAWAEEFRGKVPAEIQDPIDGAAQVSHDHIANIRNRLKANRLNMCRDCEECFMSRGALAQRTRAGQRRKLSRNGHSFAADQPLIVLVMDDHLWPGWVLDAGRDRKRCNRRFESKVVSLDGLATRRYMPLRD